MAEIVEENTLAHSNGAAAAASAGAEGAKTPQPQASAPAGQENGAVDAAQEKVEHKEANGNGKEAAVASDELLLVDEAGQLDEGDESDDYDFEEEQQVVEGDDDEYVDVDDEDYEDDEQDNRPSLTALLLGNPNEDIDYEDDEAGDEYYEDEDVEPISPTTAKKRRIEEALDEAADAEESHEAKKAKA